MRALKLQGILSNDNSLCFENSLGGEDFKDYEICPECHSQFKSSRKIEGKKLSLGCGGGGPDDSSSLVNASGDAHYYTQQVNELREQV